MLKVSELFEFSMVNIDKPSGPTSFQVDEKIKNWLGLRKTSHFGTLDPKVTGVLPIALNRACKLSDYFMHKDKVYVGIMHIHDRVDEKKLREEMQRFIGKIKQLPPVKSRVKREEREREVKKFEILEINRKEILFLAEVEAGTYIRKLVHDLGERIGGAHMTELRRVRAGIFEEKKSVNLYEFKEAVDSWKVGEDSKLRKILIRGELAIKKVLPVIQVREESVKQLLTGKPLMKQDIEKAEKINDERFAVFFKDRFIEVAKKVDEGDIIARSEFVLN